MLLRLLIFIMSIAFISSCYRNTEQTQNIIKNPVGLESYAKNYDDVESYTKKILPKDYLSSNARFYKDYFDLVTDERTIKIAEINRAYTIYCGSHGGQMVGRYIPAQAVGYVKQAFTEQPIFQLQSPMGRTEYSWCMNGDVALFAMAYAGDKSRPVSGIRIIEGKRLDTITDIAYKYIEEVKEQEAKKVFKFSSNKKTGVNFWAKIDFLPQGKGGRITFFAENREERSVEFPVNDYLVLIQGDDRYELAPANAANGTIFVSVVHGSSCFFAKDRAVLVLPAQSKCIAMFHYNSADDLDNLEAKQLSINFFGTEFDLHSYSKLQGGDSIIWLKPYLLQWIADSEAFSFYK